MQKLVPISKSEAIEKFGHRFVIRDSNNKYGFIIEECIGDEGSWYDNDDSYDSKENAFIEMCKRIKENAEAKIKAHDKLMEKFKNKWTVFKYHKGMLNSKTQAVVAEKIKNYEMAKENLQEQPKIENFVKELPDSMYIPEIYFEKNKEYYYFVDSKTMHHDSKLQKVRVRNLAISFSYEKSLISMQASFENINGETINSTIPNVDIVDLKDGYINVGYMNCYLFLNKDKCRDFATNKIKEEIKSLEKILEDFG